MFKNLLKQIKIDVKKKLKYFSYKETLPLNPMHDDIYVVEFPKSGITWLQHILGNIELQLAGYKNEFITYYNHHKYLPDIHQIRESNINRFLNRTFIKSHSEYNPYYYFVIYLVRNPIDVMISYYNFMLAYGYKEDFFTFVKNEQYGIKAWKNHINSWMYNKVDAQRIHLIRYEDLVSNTLKTIKNLYINLGVEIGDSIIEMAIEKSNLHNMKKYEDHYKKYNPNARKMNFVGKEGKIKKENIMKKEVENYIRNMCYVELNMLYPELNEM